MATHLDEQQEHRSPSTSARRRELDPLAVAVGAVLLAATAVAVLLVWSWVTGAGA